MNRYPARQDEGAQIIEVWKDDVDRAFTDIRNVSEKFQYIAMDTEFPGIVARPIGLIGSLSDYNYQTVRFNVDNLKVIQLGITFADSLGNLPNGGAAWQFNFKFDLDNDMHAQDSIDFLKQSGVNFEKHQTDGIEPHRFGEQIISSGLVYNDNVRWIAFHGSYDFGYLLKLLTCKPLPSSEQDFFTDLHMYIPSLYDIKFLLMNVRNLGLTGGLSLQNVAEHLNVRRIGQQHQAGSDSLVTCRTFFKIMEKYFDNQVDDSMFAGVIYGLGVNGNKLHAITNSADQTVSNGCHVKTSSQLVQASNIVPGQQVLALGLDGPSANSLLTNIERPSSAQEGLLHHAVSSGNISSASVPNGAHPHRRAQQPALHQHTVNHAQSLPPHHHQPAEQPSFPIPHPYPHNDTTQRMSRLSPSANGLPPHSVSYYSPGAVVREAGPLGPGMFGPSTRAITRNDFVPASSSSAIAHSNLGPVGSSCGSQVGPPTVPHPVFPCVPGPGTCQATVITVPGPPRVPPPAASELLGYTKQTPTGASTGSTIGTSAPNSPQQSQQTQQSQTTLRKGPQPTIPESATANNASNSVGAVGSAKGTVPAPFHMA